MEESPSGAGSHKRTRPVEAAGAADAQTRPPRLGKHCAFSPSFHRALPHHKHTQRKTRKSTGHWASSSPFSQFRTHTNFRRAKNNLSVFGNANVRIVRGLSLSFFGNASRVRDQVFLPRSDASDEEVLLRQRDLQTDFNYTLNDAEKINLRFTFGSIFNNIVNPRFDGGGGQIFWLS